MKANPEPTLMEGAEAEELIAPVNYDFGLNRRSFVQFLGSGLLVVVGSSAALAQRTGGRGRGGGGSVAGRIHIGKDGTITVFSGKTEMGQGVRSELTQAAAEELRVEPARVQMILADTNLVPDDGITAGSRSTPATVPAVRRGAATARLLLVELACERWQVKPDSVEIHDGVISHPPTGRKLSYADLGASEGLSERFAQAIPEGVTLLPVKEWQVMGHPLPRPNRRDIVTGAHQYPSDIRRPGMVHGKVLRPPAFGATLTSIDLAPAQAMPGVTVVRDGGFVGVTAPTSHQARQALEAIAKTAVWASAPQPSSRELYSYLREHARGGVPKNPFAKELAQAAKTLRATYHVPYVQHAPMEPRVAVAEWEDGRLTVWAGTQNPFGYRQELMRAFRLPAERVRVVVPDFGGGFGGKHTGEAAVEAARLAQAAGKPVSLRWTREEEFTWAYFRPAGVIDVEATLNAQGALTSWHCVNIASGPAAIDTPYRAGKAQSRFVASDSPLRTGSYRALAATANNFARECFMDELATAVGQDPLAFRLAHLENPRIRAVLETATAKFRWDERVKKKEPNVGVGLACGTEKGSVVAACVEIEIDPVMEQIRVRRICEAFECGPILDPANLLAQVQGCIVMGLGPALREEMRFEAGRMMNATFRKYQVPRFDDLPELDLHLLDRRDLPAVGAGETPMIAVAPAVANAVFHATGARVRELPIRPTRAQPA